MSFSFLNVPTVWAEPFTIYIRVDGSIDPSNANITTLDNFTYTFTDNNQGGIMVERDNIVLDGAGYVLQGIQNGSFHEPDPNGTVVGVDLTGRNNVTVQNLIIVNVPHGISLDGTTNCIVRRNYITTTGPWLGDRGIIGIATNATVVQNTVVSCYTGVKLLGSGNSILKNKIWNNVVGIWFEISDPPGSNCTITENDFDGSQSLIAENVYNGKIYHNNFNEGHNSVTVANWSQAVWNEAYPAGGNYWSDYSSPDLYCGPFQNETGSDGIGDIPLVLAENQTDNYPLMGPWIMTGENITVEYRTGASVTIAEVTLGGMTTFNARAGPDTPQGFRPVGSCCNISTTASFSGNVEVTLPYDPTNMTQQEEKTLKIMQWNETTLTWTNITTRVDTQLNKITGQTPRLSLFAVMWRLGGDVNGDFTVDIYDAILLAGSYNTTPQSPLWNANADMNNDNMIDIYDAIILAGNYERTA